MAAAYGWPTSGGPAAVAAVSPRSPPTSPAAAAGPAAQLAQVVVGGAGRLGGVGEQAEGAGDGHPALEVVQHVHPGGHLAVQRLHPDPDLLLQPGVGALPDVEG